MIINSSTLKRLGMLLATSAAGGTLPGVGGMTATLLSGIKNNKQNVSGNAGGSMPTKSNVDPQAQMYGQSFKDKIDYMFMHPERRLHDKEKNKEGEDAVKRLGISLSTIRLLKASPAQLINNNVSNVVASTNMIMIQLLQVSTKHVIAISRALGAKVDSIFTSIPTKSQNGFILDLVNKIEKIPGVGLAKKTAQHALNYLNILNPLTWSSRITKKFETFGDALQKIFVGKEAYKNMKDPNRLIEKAGLKISDSSKSINLLKVLNEINLKQLDVLNDLRNVIRKSAERTGLDVKYKQIDMTFDEFSGSLMQSKEASRRKLARERRLSDIHREDSRGGLIGRVGSAISPMMDFYSRVVNRNNKDKATVYDRVLVEEMFTNGLFESIFIGAKNSNKIKQILRIQSGRELDLSKIKDRDIKTVLEIANNEIKSKRVQNSKYYQEHYLPMYALSKKNATFRSRDEMVSKISNTTSTAISRLSGSRSTASTGGMVRRYQEMLDYGGNSSIYNIQSGGTNSSYLQNKVKNSFASKLQRAFLPIIGGLLQHKELTNLEDQYENLAPHGLPTGSGLTPRTRAMISTSVRPLQYQKFSIGSNFTSQAEIDTYRGVARAIYDTELVSPNNNSNNSNSSNSSNRTLHRTDFSPSRMFGEFGWDGSNDNRLTVSERERQLQEEEESRNNDNDRRDTKNFREKVLDALKTFKEFAADKVKSIAPKNKDGNVDWSKIFLYAGAAGTILKALDIPNLLSSFISKGTELIFNFIKEHPQGVAETIGIIAGGFFAKSAIGKALPWLGGKLLPLLKSPSTILLGLSLGGFLYNISNAFSDDEDKSLMDRASDLAYGIFMGFPVISKIIKLFPAAKTFISGFSNARLPVLGAGMFGTAMVGLLMNDIANSFTDDGKFKGIGSLIENLLGSDSYFGAAAKYGLIGWKIGKLYGAIAGLILGPMIKWILGASKEQENVDRDTLSSIDPTAAGLMPDPEVQKKEAESAEQIKKKLPENLSQSEKDRIHLLSTKPYFYKIAKENGTLPKYLIDNPPKFDSRPETGSGPDDVFNQGNSKQSFVDFASMVNTDKIGAFTTKLITSSLDFTSGAINLGKELFGGSSSSSGGSGGGGSYSNDINFDNSDVGVVAAYNESGNDSTKVAYDKTGGTSYGKYQFSSKQGSLKEFLDYVKTKSANGKKLYDAMYSSVGGNWSNLNTGSSSGEPVSVWKQYMRDPELQKYESEFNYEKKYKPAFNALPTDIQKIISNSRALQEALYSTVTQHGIGSSSGSAGAIPIFKKVYKSGMTPEQYLTAIYDERKTRFGSSEPGIRASVQRRLEKEKNLLIAVSNGTYGKESLSQGGTISTPKGAFQGYPNITPELLESWKTPESVYWPGDSSVITSPMGDRNVKNGSPKHMGIDIRAGTGQPVYSTMSGKVVGTSNNFGTIEIEHPGGWRSKYLHLSRFDVKSGDTVKAGQQIGGAGGVGSNGKPDAYHPHIHLEMLKDGTHVDPEAVFYSMNKTGQTRGNYKPSTYDGTVKSGRQIQSKLAGKYSETGDDQMSAMNNKINQLNNQHEANRLNDLKQMILAKPKNNNTITPIPMPVSQEGTSVNSQGEVSVSVGDNVLDRIYQKAFDTIASIASDMVSSHTGVATLTS